jgi:hypothetical protein
MAPLVHHFSPLTLYPPSLPLLLLLLVRVMAAVMLVASLLATSFSVMAKQERMRPRSSGSSHATCCSRVPYLHAGEGSEAHAAAGSGVAGVDAGLRRIEAQLRSRRPATHATTAATTAAATTTPPPVHTSRPTHTHTHTHTHTRRAPPLTLRAPPCCPCLARCS